TLALFEGQADLKADAATRMRGDVVILFALARGAAVFKAQDGRLRPLRPGEVLPATSTAQLDLRTESGSRLIGLSLPIHLLVPRFVAREKLRGGVLRAHGG